MSGLLRIVADLAAADDVLQRLYSMSFCLGPDGEPALVRPDAVGACAISQQISYRDLLRLVLILIEPANEERADDAPRSA